MSGAVPDARAGAAGSSVTAELWGGQVTKFEGIMTADSPENIPPDLTIGGVIFGVAGVVVLLYGVALVRRAWHV